jgi:hypothetical protein
MHVSSPLKNLAQEPQSSRDRNLHNFLKQHCLATVLFSHEAFKKQHVIFPIFSKRVNQ